MLPMRLLLCFGSFEAFATIIFLSIPEFVFSHLLFHVFMSKRVVEKGFNFGILKIHIPDITGTVNKRFIMNILILFQTLSKN